MTVFNPSSMKILKLIYPKEHLIKKLSTGVKLYELNKDFINSIDNKFSVEKELLLALMGIETNFGTYVGKMDILSSLATLSYDQRRSDFFTKELITIQLVNRCRKINHRYFIWIMGRCLWFFSIYAVYN